MPPRYINAHERQAREHEILNEALKLIAEQGIAFLTIDKLVQRVNYSKGTIYNHFSSKEDLLAALCNRHLEELIGLFSRSVAVDTSARKKMTGIGFAYMLSVLLSPQYFSLVMNAKTELFDKASSARREQHEQLDSTLLGIVSEVIAQAIAGKELVLAGAADIQQVAFALWSMSFGTIGLLLNGEKSCSTTTGMMLESCVIAHGNIVMDGLGWRQDTLDEQAFIQYLKTDIFADEIARLLKVNAALII